jgi:tetrahydromethanopterin S-methyltransferase subunit D
MRAYTKKEMLKLTAGAVASLVICGMGCRVGSRIFVGEIGCLDRDNDRQAS